MSSYGFDLTHTDPTGFTTEFSKVADLPALGSGPTYPGINSRSGLLQIGDELWFTTVLGGNYPDFGTISAFDMSTGQFSTKYSFGLPNPNDPTSARKDGYSAFATPVLGQGTYEGQIFYSTRYGGADWFNTGAQQSNNGGAVGVFNPVTGTSTVLWSGDNEQAPLTYKPTNAYSSPVYVQNQSGEYLYFLANGGGDISVTGTTPQGSLVRINLSNNAATTVASFVRPADYTGAPGTMPGRLPQGAGILQVEEKLYFATTGNTSLQVYDTATNTLSVLDGPVSKTAGIYGTPIYDSERGAIYAISLNSGIYKWDINTGVSETLENSFLTGSGLPGNAQASGVLFSDSIFYVTFATTETANSYIYRYDLINEQIYLLYNLGVIPDSGNTDSQSGIFNIVNENGREVLYFLTYEGGVNGTGTLLKLDVTAVPEPSTAILLAGALLAVAFSRRYVRSLSF